MGDDSRPTARRDVNSRSVIDTELFGETISFIASNDRVQERVENISHETHVLEALIERGRYDDVFWDVGACLGIHSFILASFLSDGHVVGFEPMPSNRGILVDNKSLNDTGNVTVKRTALADDEGTREFAIRESVKAGYGRHSFVADGDYDAVKTIPVEVATGTQVAAGSDGEPRPNMVKIDVEGAGPLVVEGMQELLASDECHTVIFETHEPNDVQPSHEDFGYTESAFVQLVEDCGFDVQQLEKDYHFIGMKDTHHSGALDCPGVTVELEQGDIAKQSADAIVNSAGTTLRMGTGVAGALREAGGEQLNEAAILQGPIDVGEAVRTPAFDLDADHVLHAASMPHYDNGESSPETIRQAVTNALQLAEDHGCSSVVVPMVGCGLGGVPVATGARVIRDALNAFTFDTVGHVTLIAHTPGEHDILTRVCR